MTRAFFVICAAVAMSGCTVAGDTLTPHVDKKSYCQQSKAEPIDNLGLPY